ncbi:MAG: 30S ribosome-binding factor RbfA [Bacteroidetes bacterium]|nr:30S ribosome-binding factor RbfA [Rhodothermia bacterium]MCS7154826.1 30S ribosome-binding factor RbfA [Bacteroidota bacterium]MCX7907016.1 30S ribosome-binding factor RbfA [Bacteroidota bacterium]MDW8137620.1 30S ribosome-binding factor RbfA [Bacteroidota bacterium]MDW8285426.1 30S ribosome-binding factor RbfA [Bacteroidota bacterium]
MSSERRVERVSSLIKRELADILETEFREVSHALVTVTKVQMPRDLSLARVYVSIMGDPATQRVALERLREQTPEIRRALSARIRHHLRAMPELQFIHDDTQDYVERLEALFAQIHRQRSPRSDVSSSGDTLP